MRAWLVLFVSGCAFSPDLSKGAFRCGEGGACPPGLSCAADGLCHAPGGDASAANLDASDGCDALCVGHCGMVADRCHGGFVDCHGCPTGQSCGTGNVCGTGPCTKSGCSPSSCDKISDGCGGIVDCGDHCVAPDSCGGGIAPNVCGCTPDTTAACMGSCGMVTTNCKTVVSCCHDLTDCKPVSCRPCTVANQCGDACVPADGGPCTDGSGRAGSCKGGQCVCTPSCGGKQCGADGCGGMCGSCPAGTSCDGSGQCVCTPSCGGRQCGGDGCGGSCGSCGDGTSCNGSGQCVCTPKCGGKQCGPDGCGGFCGSCDSGFNCSGSGQCVCTPNCNGKQCGDDGCGGSCGSCATGCTANGCCPHPAIPPYCYCGTVPDGCGGMMSCDHCVHACCSNTCC
jgi:hypothetical protein